MKWFCFLFAFLHCAIQADLEDHLKTAPNKSPIHSMRGIDFIYMINLDQRPEKFKLSLNQLKPYGIIPYRFSAVNGWELSLEAINDVGLKYTPFMEGGFTATSYPLDGDFTPSHEVIEHFGQTYFCHGLQRGTIGIALSHISVIKDAYDSGFETIWVMEDDIYVRRDPRVLSDLIEELDRVVGEKNWDILFTDRDILNCHGTYETTNFAARRPDINIYSSSYYFWENHAVSKDFRKIGARFGATSLIVRRSGMKKLLEFFNMHHVYLPYDMDYILPKGIRLYTVLDDVVANLPRARSDNGHPHYKTNEAGHL